MAENKTETQITDAVYGGMHDTMINLYCRWQDEQEYEDFADYEAEIRKRLGGFVGVEVLKVSSRPFGFTFKTVIDDTTWRVKVNSRTYEMTPMKSDAAKGAEAARLKELKAQFVVGDVVSVSAHGQRYNCEIEKMNPKMAVIRVLGSTQRFRAEYSLLTMAVAKK